MGNNALKRRQEENPESGKSNAFLLTGGVARGILGSAFSILYTVF